MAQSKKPADEFRLGRIKTTIWANQTKTGEVWFNVEVVRLYLEGDKWQESTKFGRDDLPIVAKAADMAFARIWSQERSAHSEVPEPKLTPNNVSRPSTESPRGPTHASQADF